MKYTQDYFISILKNWYQRRKDKTDFVPKPKSKFPPPLSAEKLDIMRSLSFIEKKYSVVEKNIIWKTLAEKQSGRDVAFDIGLSVRTLYEKRRKLIAVAVNYLNGL